MNGESDKMVPTKNTVDLDRRLPNSQLVLYPDAGHGGVFQFHADFVKRALEFLRGTVMKAFVVERYGKDGLRAADVPEPEVGDGDVLVKVSAASINPLDKMVRNGEFKRLLKYQTPFVLGHDVAGVVTRVGSAVRDFQVGDEVYARPRDLRIGTFAQYIAIDQDDVAPKPASLTLHEAAAVPLVSLAAWQALVDRAHVKPGQKVLVHAGSGGLGSTVIQLAKHLGATVATTARGENAGAGAQPRRRRRRGLHQGGLRRGPLRLRRRAGLARRREPREVPHGPQAGRAGDRRRPARRTPGSPSSSERRSSSASRWGC